MYWRIMHGLYHILSRVWSPGGHTRQLKYGTTRVLFAGTYTAKQMKTMYYSHSYNTASKFGILDDFCVIKQLFNYSKVKADLKYICVVYFN